MNVAPMPDQDRLGAVIYELDGSAVQARVVSVPGLISYSIDDVVEEVYLRNSSRVELLDHPRLVAQLCTLERRTARGGRDSIDHPPGGHDDIANVVAGVLARRSPPAVVITAEMVRSASMPLRRRW
jgi:hypothetical protein